MNTVVAKDIDQKLARKGYWPAQAGIYFADGKYSKAVDLCLRMLEKEPDIISGRLILARSFFVTGQYQQARDHFLHVLKLDADNLVALKYIGDILFREGEAAAAMSYYRRIAELDPAGCGLSNPIEKNEAVETRQLTIHRASENVISKKTASLREPAFITETVGDIYREQGYFHLAREVFSRLIETDNNHRISGKLREVEEILKQKEGHHESTNR